MQITSRSAWVVFALGFRPFFFMAGVASVLLLAAWLLVRQEAFVAGDYYGSVGWHAHEMLFGYAVAVVAGFLLTAVRNWTGQSTPDGLPLALLAILWLTARLLPWLGGIPPWMVAATDMLFLPALVIALYKPLWHGNNPMNRLFPLLLLAMTGANALVHLDALGFMQNGQLGIDLMLYLVLLLLVWVGGRVLPFFTQNVIPGFTATRVEWVETASVVLMLILLVVQVLDVGPITSAAVYLLAALIQLKRLAGWYHRAIWQRPVLWVLHLGYLWLIAGLLLVALATATDLFMLSAARHALAGGAIGVFTLGMMARVTLGHTGRLIDVSRWTMAAFIAVNVGVLLRVFGPVLVPAHYLFWIVASGILWLAAFAVFVFEYSPMLMRARADGRPG